MKQIYMTVAAALIGMTATAAPLNLKNVELRDLNPQKKELTKSNMFKKGSVIELKKKDVPTRADEASIEGTWVFLMGDYYFEDSVGEIEIEYEATLDDDVVIFEDPTGYEFPFIGTINESNKITFSDAYLGSAGQNYVFQKAFVWDDITKITYQDIEGTYNASLGTITFPADNGIAWVAYSTQSGQGTPLGYYGIYDLLEASRPVVENPEDWENIGNAKLMDGWLMPAFGLDQSEYEYEVPMQQNKENKNIYRLVNPYKYGPMAQYNSSQGDGYITFDVSDPDHVFFLKSKAGYANSQQGISQFYCYNSLGFYYEYFGGKYSVAELIELLGDDIPYTTYKDGVINLEVIYDVEDGVNYAIYDANFGIQGGTDGGYIWTDEDGNPVDMLAAIYFPGAFEAGVEEIGVENQQAVYYNLQGLKVSEPQKGQILIKKAGNKTTKVIY